MNLKLKDKVAVITGSGRGIGRAEALALASEGAKILVNDIGGSTDGVGSSSTPADEVVAEICGKGGKAVANYDTVATADGAERIIQTAIDSFGKLDILVNNAGIFTQHMIFNMNDQEWDDVVKVHLYGHFYCTRAACRWFRQQKSGRIINTSSYAGLGVPGAVHYSAAKEGIVALTRSVAREMARYNVTCNVMRPEAITRSSQLLMPQPGEKQEIVERKTEIEQELPSAAESQPEDIAPLVVYLASDEAASISGRTFLVRRGQIALYSEPAPIKYICKNGTWTVDELMDTFSLLQT